MASLTGNPVWVTGWEHGSTLTTNGGGMCDSITGSPAVSTTQKRTGSYSLRINATASQCVINRTITGINGASVRFYVRFATLPGADTDLFALNGPSQYVSVMFKQSTAKLYAYVNTGTNGSEVGSITTGVWYRVDCYLDCSANPWSWKIQVDGGTESSGSLAISGSTMTLAYIGSTISFTGDYYIDDLLITDSKSDYPLGEGSVKLLQTNADGTISNATNCIEDESGNDISVSHAGYSDVNSVPWSATNYLRVGTASSGKYLNMALSDLGSSDDPQAIGALLAYTSATTSANNAACYLLDGSTKYEIWGVTGTLRDYSDGSTSSPYFKATYRKLATMSKTQVDALQVTWESGDDANPDPYLIDVWVEVAVKSSGYQLWTTEGSFSETGSNAILLHSRKLFSTAGSFSLTGSNAILKRAIKLLITAGSFSETGSNAILKWLHILFTGLGSYTETGSTSFLKVNRQLRSGLGTFTLAGNDATLTKGAAPKFLWTTTGSFSLTGSDAKLFWNRLVYSSAGTFSLTGNTSKLYYNRAIVAKFRSTWWLPHTSEFATDVYAFELDSPTEQESLENQAKRGSYTLYFTGLGAENYWTANVGWLFSRQSGELTMDVAPPFFENFQCTMLVKYYAIEEIDSGGGVVELIYFHYVRMYCSRDLSEGGPWAISFADQSKEVSFEPSLDDGILGITVDGTDLIGFRNGVREGSTSKGATFESIFREGYSWPQIVHQASVIYATPLTDAEVLEVTRAMENIDNTASLHGESSQGHHNYALLTESGTFSETGSNSTLLKGLKLWAGSGSFVLTGNDAILAITIPGAYYLWTTPGSFILTGQNSTELWNRKVYGSAGSFNLTGSNGILLYNRMIKASAGSLILSGQNAFTLALRMVRSGNGSFLLSGQDARLLHLSRLLSGTGSFTLTGLDAILLLIVSATYFIWVDTGTFLVTPGNALLYKFLPGSGETILVSADGSIPVSTGAPILVGSLTGLGLVKVSKETKATKRSVIQVKSKEI